MERSQRVDVKIRALFVARCRCANALTGASLRDIANFYNQRAESFAASTALAVEAAKAAPKATSPF